jgi:hypothetical protein
VEREEERQCPLVGRTTRFGDPRRFRPRWFELGHDVA